MNRLAFSTLGCPEWTFEEAVSAAKRIGYEGLEVRLLDGEVLPWNVPDRQVQRVKGLLDDSGLEAVCVDTSLRVSKPSKEIVRQAAAYCEIAAAWKAPYIRVFGGDPRIGLGDNGAQIAVEQLKAMLPAAQEHGVTILVETHDVFAGSRPLAEVLSAVDSPRVGALWDLLHPWRVGEEPSETFGRLAQWIHLVHIKDGVRTKSGEAELRMLGEGDVPTAEALRLLRESGYDGWLCVEWERKWHPHLAPAEEALTKHVEELRKLGVG